MTIKSCLLIITILKREKTYLCSLELLMVDNTTIRTGYIFKVGMDPQ